MLNVEDCNFNKNDYILLEYLIGNECFSPFKSFTTKLLIELSGFSHVKVRNTMKSFLMFNLVKEGAKEGNNKTYYVTKEGESFYMRVMDYDEEDIKKLRDSYMNSEEDE